jgi:hypothetical protein
MDRYKERKKEKLPEQAAESQTGMKSCDCAEEAKSLSSDRRVC